MPIDCQNAGPLLGGISTADKLTNEVEAWAEVSCQAWQVVGFGSQVPVGGVDTCMVTPVATATTCPCPSTGICIASNGMTLLYYCTSIRCTSVDPMSTLSIMIEVSTFT
jgi:hypothetical protein